MRKAEQLHGNVFPRMLALAERAWHKADWEDDPTDTESRKVDWELFANRLGYRELARLDALGIKYDIRPPAFSYVLLVCMLLGSPSDIIRDSQA